jgi:hypothetical protein
VVASNYHEIVGEPYGAGRLPRAAQDLMLGQIFVRELRAFFERDICVAIAKTPPERQEDLFTAIRAQLDPPRDEALALDPGAFFDAWQWDLNAMRVRDPHEIFVRLELIATHLVTVAEGFAAEGMTLRDAVIALVELREQVARDLIVPPPPREIESAPAKVADIQMLAGN